MLVISLLLVLFPVGLQSFECPIGQQPCGSSLCYDPTLQGCTNDSNVIQCINSCNGICYSNSQYCYNNTIICNNGELVCDVQIYSQYDGSSPGYHCYDASQMNCYNNTLCRPEWSCGAACFITYPSKCANNEIICIGFGYWSNVNVCGTQQICYDTGALVCLDDNGTFCPLSHPQLCGTDCYNPSSEICVNDSIQCINSCNGVCYPDSQYCYNNTIICNNGELVCDVQIYSQYDGSSPGYHCYDASQMNCYNNTLCRPEWSCGAACFITYPSKCANNEIICIGFGYWSNVNVCGTQQICYDTGALVCLDDNGTFCPLSHPQLCGTDCYNPSSEICVNDSIQCINSCNGVCYPDSQYCYNNTIICNNGELVCDVQIYSQYDGSSPGYHCYDASQMNCYNNTLCRPEWSCGAACFITYPSKCANNEIICIGFGYWSNVNVCGTQQICYDTGAHVCLDDNGTLCPIGNQLCSGVCFDPRSQYCLGGNNTIFCLENPSSSDCTVTSTMSVTTTIVTATTTVQVTTDPSATCCAAINCTTNSDCCREASFECHCYWHNQTDLYGACLNPNITPICSNGCPSPGKCKVDSDCCKCHCGSVVFTGVSGESVERKQCVQR